MKTHTEIAGARFLQHVGHVNDSPGANAHDRMPA